MTEIDLDQEVDRYFDGSSLCTDGSPKAVILMGGVAAGKTTIRRKQYSQGYVLVDGAQIFLNLSRGDVLIFPDAFEVELEQIGRMVSRRTFVERRHLVTEIIGNDFAATMAMIDALKAAGYVVNLVAVQCDIAESIERAKHHEEDHISAYYVGPMNTRWIVDALSSLN